MTVNDEEVAIFIVCHGYPIAELNMAVEVDPVNPYASINKRGYAQVEYEKVNEFRQVLRKITFQCPECQTPVQAKFNKLRTLLWEVRTNYIATGEKRTVTVPLLVLQSLLTTTKPWV